MKDRQRLIEEMVEKLSAAAGDSLVSVIVYGATAHGDYLESSEKNDHLLILLTDLSLPNITKIGAPVRWWLKKGEPMPRFFSPAFVRQAADVFPMEFLDIAAHHKVVYGKPALSGLDIQTDHLRTQCERELREKLMRLQEAYIEAAGSEKLLTRLLTESYEAFAFIFRGALHLGGKPVPKHDRDVVTEFCQLTALKTAPFSEIHSIRSGDKAKSPIAELFSRYYTELNKAIEALDSFTGDKENKL